MARRKSFLFHDSAAQQRLLSLLKKRRAAFTIDRNGAVRYSENVEQIIEDTVSVVRRTVCARWQVLFAPLEWIPIYREYMYEHGIAFVEAEHDGQTEFVLDSKYRPHRWKLRSPS